MSDKKKKEKIAAIQQQHPGFTASVIAAIAHHHRGDTAATTKTLQEMEKQQQTTTTTTTTPKKAPPPQPAQPAPATTTTTTTKAAKKIFTAQEIEEARRQFAEAARVLQQAAADIPSTTATATATTPAPPPPPPAAADAARVTARRGAAKGTITYSYSTPAPTTTSDWVAVYIHNRTKSYQAYRTCTTTTTTTTTQHDGSNGGSSGSGEFSGLCDGTYDVRLLRGSDTEHFIARSEPVVLGTPVMLTIREDRDQQPSSSSRDDSGTVVTVVTTKKMIVDSREEQDDSKDGGDGGGGQQQQQRVRSKDWVGLYSAGMRSNKQYQTWSHITDTSSAGGGRVEFEVPRMPGEYHVRYFKAGSGYAFSGSARFMVPNTDRLEVSAVMAGGAGREIEVRWRCRSRARTTGDWIGLFSPGATDRQYHAFEYLSRGTFDDDSQDSGVVRFDLRQAHLRTNTPGAYEFRLLTKANELICTAPVVISDL
jgi:hypothetical protein